jgi:UDP-N-acetylmuramoyl-tripeptide--D-alanyl-D-alanine ligase
MQKILFEQLARWTCSKIISGNPDGYIRNFSTDTRTLREGDFFIPIKGPNFDGHDFIEESLKKGASGFVYSKEPASLPSLLKTGSRYVLFTRDTLSFLKDAASNYIRGFGCLKIGITGSVGKTTTKNFLASILKAEHDIVTTPKNYNNEIGVPLSIFNIEKDTDFFVAELGMRAKGQIEELSRICDLDYGIITAVGKSHIEYFDSEEDIARAKSEISVSISENKGKLFINDDDKHSDLISTIVECEVIRCGLNRDLPYSYMPKDPDEFDRFRFELYKSGSLVAEISLKMSGRHIVTDAFLAASLALNLGQPIKNIKQGLEEARGEEGRMELIEKDSKTIINDCYNSNPMSLKKAIDTLKRVSAKRGSRSVAVLGDMLELGEHSARYHKEMGKYIAKQGIDVLVVFGKDSQKTFESFKSSDRACYFFKDKKDMEGELVRLVRENDVILIKGSRANRMEDIKKII